MYLFDTNVLSEVLRKKPSAQLLERLFSVPSTHQFTSIVCLVELRFGAMRRPDGPAFWEKISKALLPSVRLLPVDETVAMTAGDLWALLAKRGKGISFPDLLIGATALAHQLTLVTGNIKHFREIPDLKIENWV